MARSVRLVELLGSLSLASDLADGFAPETTARSAVLSSALARLVGGDERLVSDSLYGSLIRHIGCTGFAVEEAQIYGAGDDVALRRVMAAVDFTSAPEEGVARITAGLAPDASPGDRNAAIGRLLGDGPQAGADHAAAQCDAAESLAALLPIAPGARVVASEAFERWDGTGGPYGRGGEDLSLVTRVVEVAYVAELFRGREGRVAALETLQRRAGSQLDPTVVAAFVDSAADLFALVEPSAGPPWSRLLDAEPHPIQRVSDARLDDIARALARFADLKSAWFNGHSDGVARLAEAAAVAAGCDAPTAAVVRIAGLLHDVGRVGIATGLWEAPRRLTAPEIARVQLHTWETHRILASVQLFDDVARTASCAHERLDGSGYHRNARAHDTDLPGRLLAAADVACALSEDRPHRPAATPAEAAALLSAEATVGRLDHLAVRAVLAAGGRPQPVAVTWPAGLSDREVEVLRLIASGASSKDTARALHITAKTVAHHVEHIYDKIGCRSRAGATLFALNAGLTGPGAPSS